MTSGQDYGVLSWNDMVCIKFLACADLFPSSTTFLIITSFWQNRTGKPEFDDWCSCFQQKNSKSTITTKKISKNSLVCPDQTIQGYVNVMSSVVKVMCICWLVYAYRYRCILWPERNFNNSCWKAVLSPPLLVSIIVFCPAIDFKQHHTNLE